MRALIRVVAAQAVVFTLVVSVPGVVLAVFPGVLRITVPVLCPDDKPDAHIVEYHTQTSDGVGTSYTLVCQGPRGDIDEIGSWKPLGVYFVASLLVLELLVVPLALLGLLRRRRRGPANRPPFGPPPFGPPPHGPPGRRSRWGTGGITGVGG